MAGEILLSVYPARTWRIKILSYNQMAADIRKARYSHRHCTDLFQRCKLKYFLGKYEALNCFRVLAFNKAEKASAALRFKLPLVITKLNFVHNFTAFI